MTKFRDSKLSTARREASLVKNRVAKKAAVRAVRRARAVFIAEQV